MRAKWTPEEDAIIKQHVPLIGPHAVWRQGMLPGKTEAQVRTRAKYYGWNNADAPRRYCTSGVSGGPTPDEIRRQCELIQAERYARRCGEGDCVPLSVGRRHG